MDVTRARAKVRASARAKVPARAKGQWVGLHVQMCPH